MANKIVLESHFKEAIAHADSETYKAIAKATDAGEREANMRLERANASRGYNLPANVERFGITQKSGGIQYPEFFGRFFEYGTVFIDAMPFMRPGHRKMRAVFKAEMGDMFEGWRRGR